MRGRMQPMETFETVSYSARRRVDRRRRIEVAAVVVRGLKARPVIARAEGPGTGPERYLQACKAATKRIRIMFTYCSLCVLRCALAGLEDILRRHYPALQAGLSHDGLSAL
jgi:hypothetical protein